MTDINIFNKSLESMISKDFEITYCKPFDKDEYTSSFYASFNNKKLVKEHSVDLDFSETEKDSKIYDIDFSTKYSLLAFFQMFELEYKPLIILKDYYHDLNFLMTFCYGKQLPHKLYPKKLKNIINNYVYDGNHYGFSIESFNSEKSPVYISVEFQLDLNKLAIIHYIHIHYRDFSKKLSLNSSVKEDYYKFLKDSLEFMAAKKLGMHVDEVRLSHYNFLNMVSI